jgi:DUF1680 family protein
MNTIVSFRGTDRSRISGFKLRLAAACGLACLAGLPAITTGQPLQHSAPQAARPFPLTAVRLTGGPLKHAQDITANYLLSLEPDRMMAGYRIQAGLEPKAEGYGGWDRTNSRQLTGHIAGHHLSAVSLMYANTGDARFKERADYLVKEMKEVQDKRGSGYLGAISDNQGNDGEAIFEQVSQGNIRSGGFDMNGLWSPWYTLHKTYAGLRDAYRFTGNKTALELEIKFAAWAEKVLGPLNDAQIQRMLNTEFGGMNEIMVDLYADTGDKRWLDLSYKFEHRSFIEPLSRRRNVLANRHGNTAIPKLIGSIDRFAYAGDARDYMAANYFWDQVVRRHTFATGGHGQVENFPAADRWGDVVSGGGRTAETCNIYNMLKLTRRLFEFNPDPEYADFHERAMYNHMLASIDPNDARTSYMVPVGQGVRQEYANMYDSFTCCVGSGMESHALHADGLFYEMDDKLWVNVYAPSTAEWAAQGVKLAMETDFPAGETAKLTLNIAAPKELTIAVRRPYWAGDSFALKVNGEVFGAQDADEVRGRGARGRGQGRGGRGRGGQDAGPPVSSYVEIKRVWKSGDTVEITMPMALRLEPTPDVPTRVAILYGPLVLAGDLGPVGGRRGRGRGQGDGGGQDAALFSQAGQVFAQVANQGGGQSGQGDPAAGGAGQGVQAGAQGGQAAQDAGQGQRQGRRGRRGGGNRGNRGGRGGGVPVFVAADRPVEEWLKPVDGQVNQFRTDGVGRLLSNPQAINDVTFNPFYLTHRRTYGIYWDLMTPSQFEAAVAAGRLAETERRRQIEAATLAFAQPGQMQPERDFNYQSSIEERPVEELEGRNGRAGAGWFSFDLPVEAGRPLRLLVTYHGQAQQGAAFEILVDGARVGRQPDPGSGFYDVEYDIPPETVQGKEKVTVRFQAADGGQIAAIFGVRIVRAEPQD